MSILSSLPLSDNGQYCCLNTLDLYNSPTCDGLATQAAQGRQLRLLTSSLTTTEIANASAIQVQLCEDDYQAWLPLKQLPQLEPATEVYQAIAISRSAIEKRLPEVIAFTQAARQQPNEYLWGGTVAPNYDCSGLMQAAFAHSGIWLPRDSYQQEAFTQRIAIADLLPGDLIFFGDHKVNHVALHLGDRTYIHSSGKDKGRNGIGIDQLAETDDPIGTAYYHTFWSCGRVMHNYCRTQND